MAHHTTIIFSAAGALLLCAGAAAAPAPVIGMPGCETRCGDKIVPYPFGMGPIYCYMPGFNLTCDWLSDPPRLLLGDGTLHVAEDIGYLSDATLAVVHAGNIQTDGNGHGRLGGGFRDGGPYALPPAGNQLVLVGCNVRATLRSGNLTLSSCSSFCHDGRTSYMKSGKSSMLCSGMGCCQAPIVVNREVAAGGKLVPITSYESTTWRSSPLGGTAATASGGPHASSSPRKAGSRHGASQNNCRRTRVPPLRWKFPFGSTGRSSMATPMTQLSCRGPRSVLGTRHVESARATTRAAQEVTEAATCASVSKVTRAMPTSPTDAKVYYSE